MKNKKDLKALRAEDQKRSKALVQPSSSSSAAANEILHLQRTLGNQAVQQLIKTKFQNEQPGDSHSQQAGEMAQETGPVSQAPASHLSGAGTMIQRSPDDGAGPTATTPAATPAADMSASPAAAAPEQEPASQAAVLLVEDDAA